MTRPGPQFGPDADGFAELRALLAFHHVPEVPSLADALETPDPSPSANGVVPAQEPVIAPGLDLTAALAELAGADRALEAAEAPEEAEEPAETEEPDVEDPPAAEEPEPLVRAVPEPVPGPRTKPTPTPFEETAEGPDVMAVVARAQAGDAAAFGELYDRYVDLVYRYIYYRVGTQTLTEDLVSETFLRALRRITSFSWQGRDFAAWLVTIARNLIADHFKSGRYRLEVATADMLEADRAQDGPEGEVLDAMTNERLVMAVKQLNSEQQECVVLRFLQGMSVTETALAMGKTEGAIKALQYRAVRSLARLLPRELVQ